MTARLKKYIEETEFWLRKYNIQYNNLVMLNLESAEQRRTLGLHGSFKAQVYVAQKESELFIESEPLQALEIVKLAKKDVFCVSNRKVYRWDND